VILGIWVALDWVIVVLAHVRFVFLVGAVFVPAFLLVGIFNASAALSKLPRAEKFYTFRLRAIAALISFLAFIILIPLGLFYLR